MRNNLTQNAAYNVLYRILNVIFPLITATYISRILGPEGVGSIAYAQNIVAYFVMVAALGIPSYGTREVAKCRGDQDAENKLFSELFFLNAISTTVCVSAYIITVKIMNPEQSQLFWICGLAVLFNYITIDWLYQGSEEYVYITRRSILVKVLSLIATFIFVKKSSDYIIYALIVCMGTCCNNAFNIVHAGKKVKLICSGLEMKRHIRPILVLMLSSITASLYNKVDITMLGWMHPPEVVGFYSNGHKMVNIGLTLVTAITAVFMPRLSYYYQHEREKFQKLVNSGVHIILLLAIPMWAGMILTSEDLVTVFFGDLFVPAVGAIQIMSALILVMGLGDLLCYQVVISMGQEKKLIKSRVIAGVVNIILNALLIPEFRHNGAAVASVISEIIVNGVLLRYVLQTVQIQVNRRFLISVLLSVSAMTLAVLTVQQFVAEAVWALIGAVAAGVMVYFAALIITKNTILLTMLRKEKKM